MVARSEAGIDTGAELRTQLAAYATAWPSAQAQVAEFLQLLDAHPNCFQRDCWAGHITGSAWLVSPCGKQVLLTHHRKLGAWLQLGGHSDGNPNTWEVAVQEAQEESGIPCRLLLPTIFDLDIHRIPARKMDPEHRHFDVRYLCIAAHRNYQISAESLDLAWVPMDDLASHTQEPSMLRMAAKWRALRSTFNLPAGNLHE